MGSMGLMLWIWDELMLANGTDKVARDELVAPILVDPIGSLG